MKHGHPLALPLVLHIVLVKGSREEFTEDVSISWLVRIWGLRSMETVDLTGCGQTQTVAG